MPVTNFSPDYLSHLRTIKDGKSNLFSNGSLDLSTFNEVCSSISYFKSLMTELLKDAASQCTSQNECFDTDFYQEGLHLILSKKYVFPGYQYFSIYEALIDLLVQFLKLPSGYDDFVHLLLDCISFTIVFFNEASRIEVPFKIAEVLSHLKDEKFVFQEILMKALCRKIIPVCFGILNDKNLHLLDEMPTLILLLLESVQDVSLHFQLIEILMVFKRDLWIDIMSVISYSDGISKVFATQLLFHYWPNFRPGISSQHKIKDGFLYESMSCQHPNCHSLSPVNTATAMVFNAIYSAKVASEPPMLYLCNSCTETACKEKQCWSYADVVLPSNHIAYHCENKQCLGKNSIATVTLLGTKLAHLSHTAHLQMEKHSIVRHYDNRLVRFCEECYSNISHILQNLNLAVQSSPTTAWHQDKLKDIRLIVDTVISLLLEDSGFITNTLVDRKSHKNDLNSDDLSMSMKNTEDNVHGIYPCNSCEENMEYQLNPEFLNHFGVWLLVSLCPPREGIDHSLASQLIGAVLVWYKNTSRHSKDGYGNCLENLKTMLLRQWIKDMYKYYFKNFLHCLIPNPPPESRVGGYWDSIHPLWYHYKNGLNFITCLATYSIISYELWDCLIPCWMMALCENLELNELKKVKEAIKYEIQLHQSLKKTFAFVMFDAAKSHLFTFSYDINNELLVTALHWRTNIFSIFPLAMSVLFDQNMSPFAFEKHALYNFVVRNFKQRDLIYHENAMEWLQVLCNVSVFLPLPNLFEMMSVCTGRLRFSFYVTNSKKNNQEQKEEEYHLPHLTDEESQKLISQSCERGVLPFTEILGSFIYTSYNVCYESDCQNFTASVNENKKGLQRTGSSRASKRLKATLKSKMPNSMHRRAPKLSDESGSEGRTSNQTSCSSSKIFLVPDDNSEYSDERRTSLDWNAARIIACYVDLLDVVHQQLLLQHCRSEDSESRSAQSIPVQKLLCELLWQLLEYNEGSTHTKDPPSQFVLAELSFSRDLFELAAKLLCFVLPEKPPQKSSLMNSWNASSDPNSCSSHSSFRKCDYRQLKLPLQLVYLFLKALEYYESDRDVIDHVIECVSLLFFKGEFGQLLVEAEKPIGEELELKVFIPSLWKHLDVARPDSSKNIVAVLFNVLNSVENAWHYLFQIVGSSFSGDKWTADDKSIESWNDKFEALDRIHALLMFIHCYEKDYTVSRSPASHTIAYLLCLLLAALYHRSSAIHIKAKFIMEELSVESLRVACDCLQFEFESSLKDRVFVLSRLLQIHRMRPDSSALSFTRCSEVMNILAREAHALKLDGIVMPFPPNACSHKNQLNMDQNSRARSSNFILFGEWIYRAALHFNIDDDFNIKSGVKAYSGNLVDDKDDKDSQETVLANDIATVDQVMMVICAYMISCEKDVDVKSKEFHTFFRQFQNWIGYNEQVDYITPKSAELRKTVGIYTFLKKLPKILDSNLALGDVIIPLTLSLLRVIGLRSSSSKAESLDPIKFEMDLLAPADQLAWLSTLQVMMYKYTFKDSMQLKLLKGLLDICMHTLQKEFHRCEKDSLDGSGSLIL